MKLHLFFPPVIHPGAKLYTSPGSMSLKRALDAFCESEPLTSSQLPLPQQCSRNCQYLVSMTKLQNCTSSLSCEYEFSKGSMPFCKKVHRHFYNNQYTRKAELLIQLSEVPNQRKIAKENPIFCTLSVYHNQVGRDPHSGILH